MVQLVNQVCGPIKQTIYPKSQIRRSRSSTFDLHSGLPRLETSNRERTSRKDMNPQAVMSALHAWSLRSEAYDSLVWEDSVAFQAFVERLKRLRKSWEMSMSIGRRTRVMTVAKTTPNPTETAIGFKNWAWTAGSARSGTRPTKVVRVVSRMARKRWPPAS